MKTIITFFSLILFAHFAMTQINPCVNNVSTNPQNPNNDNLPNNSASISQLYLNGFDWYPTVSGFLVDYPVSGMPLLNNFDGMKHIFNNNLLFHQHYNYLLKERLSGLLPKWENGWELIGVNLGKFPDGTPFSGTNISNPHQSLPYIILYNKYESKLRVFFKPIDSWVDVNFWHSVKIVMKHEVTANNPSNFTPNSNYFNSGQLRTVLGKDLALDQETEKHQYVTLSAVDNVLNQWFSADFYVAFDPCVCRWPSQFRFDMYLTRNIDLQLHGGGISLNQNIVNDQGQLTHSDYFSHFQQSGGTAENGFVMYDELDRLISQYEQQLEAYENQVQQSAEHNKKVKRNKAILKGLRMVMDLGLVFIGSPPWSVIPGVPAPPLTAEMQQQRNQMMQLVSQLYHDGPEFFKQSMDDASQPQTKIDWIKLIKEADKVLGKNVSAWIMKNFQEVSPSKPSAPMATFTEMYFSGKTTEEAFRGGVTILSPGSYGNSWTAPITAADEYPVYNEALGVFALLRTPKIAYSSKHENKGCSSGYTNQTHPIHSNANVELPAYTYKFEETYQFRLAEPLKYYINPALKIEDVEIESFIVMTSNLDVGTVTSQGILNNTKFRYNNNRNINAQFEFNEYGITEQNIDEVPYDHKININSFELPLDNLMTTNQSVGLDYAYTYIDPPVFNPNHPDYYLIPEMNPMFCLNNPATFATNQIQGIRYKPTFQVKIMLKIKYQNDLQYQRYDQQGVPYIEYGDAAYTYLYTYDIPETNVILNPSGFDNDLVQGGLSDMGYANVNIHNVNFGGQHVSGCHIVNGNQYVCRSLNPINVTGINTVSNGFTALIESGHSVNMLSHSETDGSGVVTYFDTEVHPEIVLNVTPMLQNTVAMPPQTPEEVASFCDNNGYKANHTPNFNPEDDIEFDWMTDESNSMELLLYPNPASQNISMSFTANEPNMLSWSLIDITGGVIKSSTSIQQLRSGSHQIEIDLNGISNGVYLVKFHYGEYQTTRRFIKL